MKTKSFNLNKAKNTILKNIIVLSLILFTIVSCSAPKSLKIGLSKGIGSTGYEAYCKWLNSADYDVECINLYNIPYEEAKLLLKECSGLVLTGGPDVHPGRYGLPHDTSRCDIDLKRDTLEFMLIEEAQKLGMPIFAICRGEQIFNVAFGGSLFVDIPEDVGLKVQHRCVNPDTCFHQITISDGTLLQSISGVDNGLVNSNHHQAVNILAKEFIATAFTEDGLIEAYEYKDKSSKPFFIAVQWHPERLTKGHPLSEPLLKRFLQECRENVQNQIKF